MGSQPSLAWRRKLDQYRLINRVSEQFIPHVHSSWHVSMTSDNNTTNLVSLPYIGIAVSLRIDSRCGVRVASDRRTEKVCCRERTVSPGPNAICMSRTASVGNLYGGSINPRLGRYWGVLLPLLLLQVRREHARQQGPVDLNTRVLRVFRL